jgi:hypothetical protein
MCTRALLVMMPRHVIPLVLALALVATPALAAPSPSYYCQTRYGSSTCVASTKQSAVAFTWGTCDSLGGTDIVIASASFLTGYSCTGFTANVSNCVLCAADNSRCPSLCQTTANPWQGALPSANNVRDGCTPSASVPNAGFVFSWPTTSTRSGGPCLAATGAPAGAAGPVASVAFFLSAAVVMLVFSD